GHHRATETVGVVGTAAGDPASSIDVSPGTITGGVATVAPVSSVGPTRKSRGGPRQTGSQTISVVASPVSSQCSAVVSTVQNDYAGCEGKVNFPSCISSDPPQVMANTAGLIFANCICVTSFNSQTGRTCSDNSCDARLCNATLINTVTTGCASGDLNSVDNAFGFYLTVNGAKYFPNPNGTVLQNVSSFCLPSSVGNSNSTVSAGRRVVDRILGLGGWNGVGMLVMLSWLMALV
ncbi:hypothetical protein HDU76_005610, partial [Blyttiomyces sp. JEL0837]